MKNTLFSSAAALLLATSTHAITTVGDGVPLIYAPTPYPASIYNGTQYNATVINGVPYNASNEWPCLDEAGYESIIPTCSLTCISLSLAQDDCDVDDFTCHCTAEASAKIDSHVVPCLTSGPDALCTGEEIGQLANFVHGALCPYFIAVGYGAYEKCDVPWPSWSSASWSSASSASASSSSWGAKPTGPAYNGTWSTSWAGAPTTTGAGWASKTGAWSTSATVALYTGAASANKVAGAVVGAAAAAGALFL